MKQISVDLGDGKISYMDEKLLDGPHVSVTENDHEKTTVTEYFFMGRKVHRAVNVHLKHGLNLAGIFGKLGS